MPWTLSKVALVGALSGAAIAGAIAAAATGAEAKSTYESPYGYERTWNAALRLVRVDNGWKITEKDEGSGYLLFEYRSIENSKALSGSIELVKGTDADAPVDVLVRIPQMPPAPRLGPEPTRSWSPTKSISCRRRVSVCHRRHYRSRRCRSQR